MARPVMQTSCSMGVSYVVFRGLKRLLSKHVPEEWINVEQQQKKKVESLVQRVADSVSEQFQIPEINEATTSIFIKELRNVIKQLKTHELILYLVIIFLLIFIPPLTSLLGASKRKSHDKEQPEANNLGPVPNLTHEPVVKQVYIIDEPKPVPENNEDDFTGQHKSETMDECIHEEESLEAIKEELEEEYQEELQEEFLVDPEEEEEIEETRTEVEDIQESLENDRLLEEEEEEMVESYESLRNEKDNQEGPEDQDTEGTADVTLEPNEKEYFEPEMIFTLEKNGDEFNVSELEPSKTFYKHTEILSDSQSSIQSPKLFYSTTSSFIQFSPSKSSHLIVETNKNNAYSQPFEYKAQ